MRQGSTIFLRAAVFLMGIAAIMLCIGILPEINQGWALEQPELAYLKYPIMAVLLSTTIPFFIALYQTLKLLQYVDKNKAFSELSIKALQRIKYCAFVFGGLYGLGMPLIYHIGDKEDAPGLIVIGMVMTFAPIVIAVFAAVLQKLLQNAIDIKSENDLTV
jgi:hypothetical protein